MAFTDDDLKDLAYFIDNKTTGTCSYIDVQRGIAKPGSIALRHDVDHDIDKAVRFAEWENERNFRSTYFVLTTAHYYEDKENMTKQLNALINLNHEVGFHNDALCKMDGDVVAAAEHIITEKLWMQNAITSHYSILGIADHGGAPHANGEIWEHYTPESLGFEYEAYQLQKATNTYISDNQGTWRSPREMAQTFMLIHPTHWPV